MKILLIGDRESSYLWDHFDHERFRDIDCIISSGDLKSEYLRYLVTITNVPLFYVHGNHDEHYATNPPEGCDNIDGHLITFKGVRILGLGGSFLYNHGPFQYTDSQMSLRVLKLKLQLFNNKGFDILVSHAPALGLGDGKDICHRGFKAFNGLIDKYSPRFHVHGHQHLSYNGQQRVITCNKTTIINSYEYYLLEF